MKKIMLSLLLCMDLALASAQFGTITYNIPAAGQTVTLSPFLLSNTFIALQTDGAVNLGGNTYTLTYSSLPSNGFTWRVKMDFRNLTQSSSGANITIFGVKPLQAHPDVDTFDITYAVIPDSVGTKYLYYIYNGLTDMGVFNANTAFNGVVTFNDRTDFNDTAVFYSKTYLKPVSAISTGNSVVASDTTGKLTYGCTPWCITGNSGLSTTLNFLGNTDTTALRFRVNNASSGIIDYTLLNTALGYQSLLANTTGYGGVALGYWALKANTTGLGNVGVGVSALVANTTGAQNTAVGENAVQANTSGQKNTGIGDNTLPATTTGSFNTGIGSAALTTLTTGSYNTALGRNADVATASTQYAIALGANATASSNQLAIKGVRTISLPSATSAVNYILTDTSGTGDFIPKVNYMIGATTFTPVTGDSISITTSQNDLNPAGTIAVLTVILPASPYSGQILEFSATQVITSLLWSIRLSGGTTTGLPSTLAQYGTAKIKWNSTLSRWLNY